MKRGRFRLDDVEAKCGHLPVMDKGKHTGKPFDEDGGIEPGVAFEDLPEAWRCPLCGAMKKYFEKVE